MVKKLELPSDGGEVNSGQFQADRVPMSLGPGQHSLAPFPAFTISAPTFDVIMVVGARPRVWTSRDVSLLTPTNIRQWVWHLVDQVQLPNSEAEWQNGLGHGL